jgi:hypothetical protein
MLPEVSMSPSDIHTSDSFNYDTVTIGEIVFAEMPDGAWICASPDPGHPITPADFCNRIRELERQLAVLSRQHLAGRESIGAIDAAPGIAP